MGGTIVCGVTDSGEARAAAQLAGALSARLGLRLVLVHVVDGLPASVRGHLGSAQRRYAAERFLEEVAGEAAEGAETRVVVGERAGALAQVVAEEGADLVVVGSRATGFRERRLSCGLARELESATPVPVLVAPPATRRRANQRLVPVPTHG